MMKREDAIREINKVFIPRVANDIIAALGRDASQELRNAQIKISKLQNRCFVLTEGCMCVFCPYVCEHRTVEHRSEE